MLHVLLVLVLGSLTAVSDACINEGTLIENLLATLNLEYGWNL